MRSRFRGTWLLLIPLASACVDGPGPSSLESPLAPNPSGPTTGAPVPASPGLNSAGSLPSLQHMGIPFGPSHLPTALLGLSSATLRAANPLTIMDDLAAARRVGARVVLGLVGNERRYRDAKGHFSFALWKARVDRFRGLNFSPYIQDGTIVGHYILDEPHDPTNWGGTLVTRAEVDQLARYSKQLWPSMPTVVRGWPAYLKGYQYKYLDAAWAQYSERFGPINDFIRANVRDAKSTGLALVVGLNLLAGGGKARGIVGYSGSRYAMNAWQVRSWGAALLAEPYVCAFIGWKYDERYFGRADVRSAIAGLGDKARQHPSRGCIKSR
jgi:hypothetical protein